MFDGPWQTCMLVRGLNPSECASWVQAWGSIGAIIGAILIASHAGRRLRKQQADDERALRALAIKLADDVRHLCNLRATYVPQFSTPSSASGIRTSFLQIAQPLRNAPIWKMHDVHLATEIGSIVYQIDLVASLLNTSPGGTDVQIGLLEGTCVKLIEKYGGAA